MNGLRHVTTEVETPRTPTPGRHTPGDSGNAAALTGAAVRKASVIPGWVLALVLAVVAAFPMVPAPVMAASQNWYLSDFTSSVSGADYIMYRGSGDGTSDALTIAKGTSKVWAADEASSIACRMTGSWSVMFWAQAAPPGSSLTLEIGVLSGGSFISKGISVEQSVSKNGGTLSFSVTTSSHTVNPGEYLAVKVNCTSGNKDLDLDVNDVSGNSPCYVTSPATADDYPGTVLISFTVSDYNSDGINFGSLNTGVADQPADQTALKGAVTLTVGAETNVPIDVNLKGADLSGPATFLLADAGVHYDDDNTLDEGTETDLAQGTLTTTYATWYAVAAYTADAVECYHWISIPGGQLAGNYTSTFYYQAVEQ